MYNIVAIYWHFKLLFYEGLVSLGVGHQSNYFLLLKLYRQSPLAQFAAHLPNAPQYCSLRHCGHMLL